MPSLSLQLCNVREASLASFWLRMTASRAWEGMPCWQARSGQLGRGGRAQKHSGSGSGSGSTLGSTGTELPRGSSTLRAFVQHVAEKGGADRVQRRGARGGRRRFRFRRPPTTAWQAAQSRRRLQGQRRRRGRGFGASGGGGAAAGPRHPRPAGPAAGSTWGEPSRGAQAGQVAAGAAGPRH